MEQAKATYAERMKRAEADKLQAEADAAQEVAKNSDVKLRAEAQKANLELLKTEADAAVSSGRTIAKLCAVALPVAEAGGLRPQVGCWQMTKATHHQTFIAAMLLLAIAAEAVLLYTQIQEATTKVAVAEECA